MKSSAILIKMNTGNQYKELNNETVYALKEIYVGTNSYRVKLNKTNNYQH